jgi:2-iminobutanoate/2-iminopropanoate deaminase
MAADSTGTLTTGTFTEKAHKTCQNARTVLEAAGSSLEKVVKVTVFMTDIDKFKEFNDVYAQYFTGKPARSIAEVKRLPLGLEVEIDVVAVV